ncbi:hypothetical protein V2J09_000226 [Rumex salicifolius]
MASTANGEPYEQSDDRPLHKVKLGLIDRSKKVAETKEKTKKILSEHADRIVKQAEEHERFINKDFCYYANTIFLVTLIKQPRNEKLFMVCFSFAEVRSISSTYIN